MIIVYIGAAYTRGGGVRVCVSAFCVLCNLHPQGHSCLTAAMLQLRLAVVRANNLESSAKGATHGWEGTPGTAASPPTMVFFGIL